MLQNTAVISDTISFKSNLRDLSQLIKFRLTLMVVFSTGVGYLMATKNHFQFNTFLLLLLSGFLITGAANGINQIIEKDLDKLMTRTQNRPIAQGRLGLIHAIIIVSLMSFIGIYLLATFINPISAIIGGFSLLLYAFVYTPLKQKTSLSVWIGAVAGATPPLIGYAASSGHLDTIAWMLFAFQLVWQLPHFWALAWVLNDEYNKAGFFLMPTKEGRGKKSALVTFIASMFLFPLVFFSYYFGITTIFWTVMLFLLTLNFVYQAFKLFETCQLAQARKLMFGSFYYLPLFQLVLIISHLIYNN